MHSIGECIIVQDKALKQKVKEGTKKKDKQRKGDFFGGIITGRRQGKKHFFRKFSNNLNNFQFRSLYCNVFVR
jgi:hypothetical protein